MVENASPDFNCTGAYCFANNPCSNYYSSLQPLTFVIGENSIIIPPEGYTFSGGLLGGYECAVAVQGTLISEPNFVFLGSTFFLNFVTTFDYSTNTVSLGVNPNGPNPAGAFVGN